MDAAAIPHDARVLVADGRKALVLRNSGTVGEIVLEVEQVFEAPPNAPARALRGDKPGRTATGSHRSSLGQTDSHEQQEERFYAVVAEKLEALWAARDHQKLCIIAPPRALAGLRQAIPDTIKNQIVAEYDKDLVNLPLDEIQKHLRF